MKTRLLLFLAIVAMASDSLAQGQGHRTLAETGGSIGGRVGKVYHGSTRHKRDSLAQRPKTLDPRLRCCERVCRHSSRGETHGTAPCAHKAVAVGVSEIPSFGTNNIHEITSFFHSMQRHRFAAGCVFPYGFRGIGEGFRCDSDRMVATPGRL